MDNDYEVHIQRLLHGEQLTVVLLKQKERPDEPAPDWLESANRAADDAGFLPVHSSTSELKLGEGGIWTQRIRYTSKKMPHDRWVETSKQLPVIPRSDRHWDSVPVNIIRPGGQQDVCYVTREPADGGTYGRRSATPQETDSWSWRTDEGLDLGTPLFWRALPPPPAQDEIAVALKDAGDVGG